MKVCYDMVRESQRDIYIGSTGVLTAKSYLDLLSGQSGLGLSSTDDVIGIKTENP